FKTYYDQGALAQIGHPFQSDILDLSSNVQKRSLFRWDTTTHGNGSFIGLGRQVAEEFGADGSHRDSAVDYSYSTSTDDLTQKIEYGEVTANADGTITDIGTDKRTTNISYAASSSVNMTLPSEKTILDSNGATSSDERLYYDSLALGSVNVGN